jgi:hypothetical protein
MIVSFVSEYFVIEQNVEAHVVLVDSDWGYPALTLRSDSARCRRTFPGSGPAKSVARIDSREGFALGPADWLVGRAPLRSMPCREPLIPLAVLLRVSPCEELISRVAAGRELFWFFFDFPMPKKDMVVNSCGDGSKTAHPSGMFQRRLELDAARVRGTWWTRVRVGSMIAH